MQLGTSTNLICFRPDGTRFDLCKTLELASQGGFKVFDLNFYDWSLPGCAFLTDGWRKWIEDTAEKADELGVKFGQCHAYFYDFLDPLMKTEEKQYHWMLQQRSLECCKTLGAHTCVLHPETDRTGVEMSRISLNANLEYYKPIAEQLEGMNMRLAIENMCDYGIAPKRKFCAYPDELVDFVERFRSDHVGICWDFEHADIMQQDQQESLRYIGRLLFATHVSDTYSKKDNRFMHVLPMTATIRWEEIMETLAQIRYEGDFCYEVHNYINRFPDQIIPAAVRLAYEIGEYLMDCYAKAVQKYKL